jgi:hypothetical protein
MIQQKLVTKSTPLSKLSTAEKASSSKKYNDVEMNSDDEDHQNPKK